MKPRARIIGRLLVLYRATRQIGVRELAPEIGISIATLSRIERGHAMDADTLLKVWTWLNSEQN